MWLFKNSSWLTFIGPFQSEAYLHLFWEIFLYYILKKIFFFLTFIYLWDRERQSMNRGGAEGEGDKESETGSRLCAVSTETNEGLEPTNHEVMTWAGQTLNRLSHPGAPTMNNFRTLSFPTPPKILYSLAVTPLFPSLPLHLPPNLCNHWYTFCLYRFVHLWRFI